VKPENLLIAAAGVLRVTDFGLAYAADVERLTRSGVMLGTPYYMAPEQMRGDRDAIGPPSDVWSLGVILYEVLSGGERPFEAGTLAELGIAIDTRTPEPPSVHDPTVSPALNAVCLRALTKDPAKRFPDASGFADALRAALGSPDDAGDRRSLLAGAAGLVLVLVLVLGMLLLRPASDAAGDDPAASTPTPTTWVVALDAPAPHAEVWGDALEVRGRLIPGAATPAPATAGAVQRIVVRAKPGEPFRRRVVLRPGVATLEVAVRAPDGSRSWRGEPSRGSRSRPGSGGSRPTSRRRCRSRAGSGSAACRGST